MSHKISFLTHVGGSTVKTGPRGRPRNATAFLERPWFVKRQGGFLSIFTDPSTFFVQSRLPQSIFNCHLMKLIPT
jgi:hypothetical protein